MSVVKESNGTYSVHCYFKNWKGERKQKYKRGFLKLKDAKQWEREFLSQEHGEDLYFGKLVDEFIENIDKQQSLGKLKPTTATAKKDNVKRYIKNYFGNIPIQNITISVVNEWLVYLTQNHGRAERMSSSSVLIQRNLLSQIFTYAMKNYNIKSNPVKLSDIPAPYTSDERADMWTIQEYSIFYNALPNDIYRALFNTLYFAGLRIGEALALTPADIESNIISITKTWYSNEGVAGKPKTLHSQRKVVIPHFLAEQLRNYIDTIDGIKSTDRIFPKRHTAVCRFVQNMCKKLNLPKASPHTMRHSYVSNMLEYTENYAVVAAQAGHTPATMFEKYAHAIPKNVSKTVDKLERNVGFDGNSIILVSPIETDK